MPGRIKVGLQRQYVCVCLCVCVCVWIVYCVSVSAYVCIEHPPVPKHLSVRAGLLLLHPDCCFEWFLLILSISPAHPAHHPDASQQCRESCHLHPAGVWGISRFSKIALDYINNATVVITLRQTIEFSPDGGEESIVCSLFMVDCWVHLSWSDVLLARLHSSGLYVCLYFFIEISIDPRVWRLKVTLPSCVDKDILRTASC